MFVGPIEDQVVPVDEPFALDLSAFRSGGLGPYTWTVRSGSLPGWATISGETLSGTPTEGAAALPLRLRVTDRVSQMADGNEFDVTVIGDDPLIEFVQSLQYFQGTPGAQDYTDELGIPWYGRSGSPPVLSSTKAWHGSTSLRLPGALAFQCIRDDSSVLDVLGQFAADSQPYDFCVEWYQNLDNVVGNHSICSHASAASPGDWTVRTSGSQIGLYRATTAAWVITPGGALVPGQWEHVAFTRIGGETVKLWLGGELVGSASGYNARAIAGDLAYGISPNGGQGKPMYLGISRVTYGPKNSGAHRYDAPFTPPTIDQFVTPP